MTSAIVSWNAAASIAGRPAGRDALEQGQQRRPRIVDEDPVDARPRAPAGGPAPPVAGRDLEVDRRLRLVLGDVAQAEQRRRGIEEAPRRGRERRVEPAGDLGAKHGDLARVEPGREGRPEVGVEGPGGSAGRPRPSAVARPDGLGPEEVTQRHPVGLLDGERPAGQRRPPEPREPPIPVRSATRISPPQSVPSSPIPRPSYATPMNRPGEPVLRGARGDVRVVVLHRDA